MRFIFVDEAGTSAREPVTVVVGIIADADKHIAAAEKLVDELFGAVPEAFREDFVFHAMQIFGDKKYQSAWTLTDRLRFLKSMMRIPLQLGMAITVSVFWRGSVDFGSSLGEAGLSPSQSDHLIAFFQCLAVADRNVRQYAGPNEVAMVVAEQVPEMQKFLRLVTKDMREGMIVGTEELRQTIDDEEAGYCLQSGELRIARIRKSTHFVEKSDDRLVQIADACAYGFRRYFAKEKFGVDFVRAIVGDENLLRGFAPPSGCACFWPDED